MTAISLCMIVKNEAALLGACLDAAAPCVDEIIIVDTGSTDDTREIARSRGARVIEHPWTDDFAEARNVAALHAKGAFILQLDADEVLCVDSVDKLRKFVASTEVDCALLRFHNAATLESECSGVVHGYDRIGEVQNLPRLIRNTDGLSYEGRIHEEFTGWLARRGMNVGFLDADVVHYGCVPELVEARSKRDRNAVLLRQWLAADPHDFAPAAYLAAELGAPKHERELRAVLAEGWRRLLAGKAPTYRSAIRLAIARIGLQLADNDLSGVIETTNTAQERDGIHPDFYFLRGQAYELMSRAHTGRLREAKLLEALEQYDGAASLANAVFAQRYVPESSGRACDVRRGTVLLQLGRGGPALAAFEKALSVGRDSDPTGIEASLGRVEALMALGRFDDAFVGLDPLMDGGPDSWTLAAFGARVLSPSDFPPFLYTAVERSGTGFLAHHRSRILEILVDAYQRGSAPPANPRSSSFGDLLFHDAQRLARS